MKRIQNFIILSLIITSVFSIQAKLELVKSPNFEWFLSGYYKPEMFFGKNIALLNNANEVDKVWFQRHTLDFNLDMLYGMERYKSVAAEFLFSLRNKAVWGNPNTIARTTETEIKILDEVGQGHKHNIPLHFLWMREIWLNFNLNHALGLGFKNQHSFKLGLFSFELGRGIALGNAYAVGPEILGFYTDSAVDQFAPGFLVSGDVVENTLSYDLYVAILRNKSSSLSETAQNIRGQEYGRKFNPLRGFGYINFLVAGRLNWTVFDNNYGKLTLEPYGLFNNDPEQKVEFTADASSRLGTIGMSGEYVQDRVEFGFDYAFNLGQQRVRGWDRNVINLALDPTTGHLQEINSHVFTQDPNVVSSPTQTQFNSKSTSGKTVQAIINTSFEDESQNGKKIGTVGDVNLYNAKNRFRNPYTNKYEGWMFVMDAALWVHNKDVRFAVTAGATSGDDNPNDETIDGVYSGFLPLQEIYSGKRVKSAFLLGSAGKIQRPLSTPTSNQAPSRFASVIDGFTNLVFGGAGLVWMPRKAVKRFAINPNVYAFWEEKPTNKFDALTKTRTNELASTYLGVETNIFAEFYILEALKVYFVGAVFFPGGHFTDLQGIPLSSAQEAQLDRVDRTGASSDVIPNLGNDTAYAFNMGLQFNF